MDEVNATPGDLSYLIYVSSASDHLTQSELMQLLNVSRNNNAPRQLTGLLLYRDGRFIQHLEGPENSVTAAYDHIKRDKRHGSLTVVASGPLEGRVFPEWSMGYKNMAGIRASNTEGYSECLQPNFRPSDEGDPAARLVKMFYEQIRPQ